MASLPVEQINGPTTSSEPEVDDLPDGVVPGETGNNVEQPTDQDGDDDQTEEARSEYPANGLQAVENVPVVLDSDSYPGR